MTPDPASLTIEPLVGWPRKAQAGQSYLVTVDLGGPVDGGAWDRFDEEEFDFGVALDGSPRFTCEALGEPTVVLHRFGGTYGPARFVVTAHRDPGPGTLWLTVSNRWGVPVRTVELLSEIVTEPVTAGPSHVLVPSSGDPSPGTRYDVPATRSDRLVAESPGGWSARHFTVCHAGARRDWAVWATHQLERHGCHTALLRWDPPPEIPLAETFAGLLTAPGRILLLLDDTFVRLGQHGAGEWAEALHEVVVPHAERFAAVNLSHGPPPAPLAVLDPPDLTDLDADEALHRLLAAVGLAQTPPAPAGEPPGVPRFPDTPPDVWNVPRRNSRFTGREAVLEELHTRFADGGTAGARVALRGISGVGKSQIVIEYAHRFANEYDAMWWIRASYRATVRQQFAKLAAHLGLGQQGGGDPVRTVQAALQDGRPFRRWLLIVDGAEDLEQVENLLPESGGHIALTTLNRGSAASGGVPGIHVEPFTRAESISYARRHVARLTEAEADQLADALEDFPLLLAQTCAWLDANPMPAPDYIGLLRGADADTIRIQTLPDYPLGFQASWAITLSSLERNSPAAAELLRLFAMFSPASVPVRRLELSPPDALPPRLAALAADLAAWRDALSRLSESTAVRLDTVQTSENDSYVASVEIHGIYHRFLRHSLSPDDRDNLSAVACRVLVAADPGQPSAVRSWPVYAELLPHLSPSGALGNTEAPVRDLVLHCIEYLRLREQESTGLTLCEQVLAHWQPRLAPTHPSMLMLVHQHANMLRRCGRYREAEGVGRAVVEQLAEERPPDDGDLLRAQGGLGGTLMALGQFSEAQELFQQVNRAYQGLAGPESPRAQSSLSNLGTSLGLVGRYREAVSVHLGLLVLRERLYPADDPLVLNSGLSYARALRMQGLHQDAIARQEANSALHRHTMGDHHPQTLAALHNHALCLRRCGDVSGAADLLRDLVDRCRQIQGVRHPMTLMVESDHASLLRVHGDPAESVELTSLVLDGYRQLLGDDHPHTMGVLGNRGLLRWHGGDRTRAPLLIDEAFLGMRRALGDGHPWTLGCALNAAAVRHAAGSVEEAAALREDTVRRARGLVEAGHPLLLACEHALGDGAGEPPGWDFEPQPI
ncbi:FxSxx-COOH system tetratricopeptide repeat protein [Streptomyces sp. YIM S03343]